MRRKDRCAYFSISRASTFLLLISSVALCPRATSASPSAMPGERCPPVPPHEIKNRLILYDLLHFTPLMRQCRSWPRTLGIDDDSDHQTHEQQIRQTCTDKR